MNIKIDPEFRDLIPPLSTEELENLHISISNDGCLAPLIVWKQEGILLDGHNRYAFCKKCDYDFQVTEIKLPHRDAAKDWIILNQLGRRNISPDVASDLRGKLYLNRKKAHGDRGPQKIGQNEPSFSTAEIIARETGVSAATIKRDAKFSEARDKLGITISDLASGQEKRTRKEIIATAFPEKAKPKAKPKKVPELEPVIEDEDDVECLVVDGTGERSKEDQWEILFDYFKMLPNEQQELLFQAIKTHLEK